MSTVPTVFFIDDSATMREVIKIAFRRENLNVVACHDGASALTQMEQIRPDVVISDVIMPGKDGYEVCQQIKQHPSFARTPVILMSGVVNKSVAEKAFGVKADELIRKPFQPQDLITRVRHLLQPKGTAPAPAQPASVSASAVLSSIFGNGRATARPAPMPAPMPAPVAAPAPPPVPAAAPVPPPAPAPVPAVPFAAVAPVLDTRPAPPPRAGGTLDLSKLRIEVLRLEGLVKKLQAELQAEREYSRALEAHIKTLQEAE